MSDFVQTMKDWRRMCQHMEKIGGGRSCDICPLGGCNAIYEDDGNTDYAEIGAKVATWAAENQEPVYPTWEEWLGKMGVLDYRADINPVTGKLVRFLNEKSKQPIPADIAQKLGMEPKNG